MIVTLTTDFGLSDGYVAAMKGVILSLAPEVRCVDVSHEVPAQDVMAGAFILNQVRGHFPGGTVHLAVVDPGVGTGRHPIAARLARPRGRERDAQFFVGPDNGLLALLLGDASPESIVRLTAPHAWRTPTPSHTFHGRDIFAPAAARLARGEALESLGTPTTEMERLHWPLPRADEEGVEGYVVHVDHFGNCITNITEELLQAHRRGRGVKCFLGSTIVRGLRPTYGAAQPGEPAALFGSTGRLEIGINGGHAARLLSVERGAAVTLVFEAT